MSRRLTEQELSEPDVTLIIPPSKWAELPEEVRLTLSYFSGHWEGANRVYVVPAYRMREFEQMAAQA